MGRLKCQSGKIAILNANAELLSQLIDEAPCPCSARLVHLIINHNTVSLDNKLRVLAPNLNNIRFNIYHRRSPCLGGDLIPYHVCPDEAANQIPARTGNAHPRYPGIVADIPEQVAKNIFDSLNRPSCCHQVILRHHFGAELVNYDCLSAGRADIHPQVSCKRLLYFRGCPAVVLGDLFQLRQLIVALPAILFRRNNHL